MSEQEQIFAFADELDKLVQRYTDEFDLTYASAVGVLHTKATFLILEARGEEE
jgi:hypothetical protein